MPKDFKLSSGFLALDLLMREERKMKGFMDQSCKFCVLILSIFRHPELKYMACSNCTEAGKCSLAVAPEEKGNRCQRSLLELSST